MRKDIFNHKDISCISFFNYGSVYFLINIYSDSSQLALKYLKDTKVNINNMLIMIEDFNIRDNIWDLNFPHYSQYSSVLFDIIDSFHLELFRSTEQIPTKYSDNQQNSNLVIDLIFLRPESLEYDNHTIHSDWRLTLDYIPLTVDISIFEKHIQTRKCMLVKNSEEEDNFINKLMESIKEMNTKNIHNKSDLKQIIQEIASTMERIWYKHSKIINITKHSNQKSGGTNSIEEILKPISNQDILITGKDSEVLSKRQSMISLT